MPTSLLFFCMNGAVFLTCRSPTENLTVPSIENKQQILRFKVVTYFLTEFEMMKQSGCNIRVHSWLCCVSVFLCFALSRLYTQPSGLSSSHPEINGTVQTADRLYIQVRIALERLQLLGRH